MQPISSSGLKRIKGTVASFTLVELLAVIAIIAALAALTLAASQGAMAAAARNRARGEIQAMKTALEGYKTDNGAYPSATNFASTNSYALTDGSGSSSGPYQLSSKTLYQALSGQTNYYDTPVAGQKAYMYFKTSQLIGYKTGTGPTYIKDPWGFSYAYNTGDANTPQQNPPYSGTGFYDLWSTGGLTGANTTNINTWIASWMQ